MRKLASIFTGVLLATAVQAAFAATPAFQFKLYAEGIKPGTTSPSEPGDTDPPVTNPPAATPSFSLTGGGGASQIGPDGQSMPVIDFGSVAVGALSSVVPLTLVNQGAAFNLTGVGFLENGASANFSQSNNCGSGIAAGGGCTVNSMFVPSVRGTFSATFMVAAEGVVRYVGLYGRGTSSDVRLPAGVNFGTVETSDDGLQTFTMNNQGDLAATGVSVQLAAASGLSLVSSTCGTSAAPITLPPLASCSVSLKWTPTGQGTLTGTLTSNITGKLTDTPLSGTATQGTLVVSPAGLITFPKTAVGETVDQVYSVSNSGAARVQNLRAEVFGTGLSLFANTCGTPAAKVTLAKTSGNCQVTVRYAPTVAGAALPADARLVLTSNAVNSAVSRPMAGTASTGIATVNTGDLTFTPVAYGTTAPTKTLEFKNTGDGPMSITGFTGQPAGLTYTGTCDKIAPNATCSFTFSLSTATANVWTAVPVTTQGADTNATVNFTGSVTNSNTSCAAIKANNPSAANGIYNVDPDGAGSLAPINVYCDMTTDGGGWTLAARILTTSIAHANVNAVGTLTSPSQGSVAKLSDTYINALMNPTTGIMRLTATGVGVTNYYKTNGSRFAGSGAGVSRPVSATLNGTYMMTKVNASHGDLNGYQSGIANFVIYGTSTNNDGCRLGIGGAGGAATWCGPGDSGYLYVR